MDKDKWAILERLRKGRGEKVERIAKGLGRPGEKFVIAILIEQRSGLSFAVYSDQTKGLMTEKERLEACQHGGDCFTLILPNLTPGSEDQQVPVGRYLVDRAKESVGTNSGHK